MSLSPQAGYLVVFLHRKQSILPFTSDLPEGSVLQLLQTMIGPNTADSCNGPQHQGDGEALSRRREAIAKTLQRASAVETAGTLLSIGFETIFEYLKASAFPAPILPPL